MKLVVLLSPPPVPVTVIVALPVATAAEAVKVSVVVHVGLQDASEKAALTSEGSPEAENETLCAAPETKVLVTKLLTDWPRVMLLFPPLASEKLKELLGDTPTPALPDLLGSATLVAVTVTLVLALTEGAV